MDYQKNYRKVDNHGRVYIPLEIRDLLNFRERETIEIRFEHGDITVRKFTFPEHKELKSIPMIGIVRDLDSSGRFVIPKCFLRILTPFMCTFSVYVDKNSTIVFTPIRAEYDDDECGENEYE